MDLSSVLGWGSPIGLGVLIGGIGLMWKGFAALMTARKNKLQG
jgi:hypothetical protein